ncbi:CLUMA_CG004101, isoform A [Clunio marinus]|uniref:CLUMA_CG004101, isoform A n=1 Tax=Clunio marinus TaxID=568069 RepID=A0A1J1HQG7_9DIPT|nr:CLUMA_CG004101, isoform A [Clunio marinus]
MEIPLNFLSGQPTVASGVAKEEKNRSDQCSKRVNLLAIKQKEKNKIKFTPEIVSMKAKCQSQEERRKTTEI